MHITGPRPQPGAGSWVWSTERLGLDYTPGHMTEGHRCHTVLGMEGSLVGGRYEIVVGASLDQDWTSWFGDFEAEAEGASTRLRGSVPDQPALHGVLARLRDLGLPILEVHHVGTETGDTGAVRGIRRPGPQVRKPHG